MKNDVFEWYVSKYQKVPEIDVNRKVFYKNNNYLYLSAPYSREILETCKRIEK